MNQNMVLKGDSNNNGKIDNNNEERANIAFNARDIQGLQNELKKLKRKVNVGVSNQANEFASCAKIAEELSDGKQRVYFNNVNKSVVFKNGNKPMTNCLQIGTNDNSLNHVSHIHFNNGSVLMGLCDDLTQELTSDEEKQYVPTMNLIKTTIDPHIESIYEGLISVMNKTHDLSYNEEEEETTIEHDLSVGGEIKNNWLNGQLASKSDVGHIHAIADVSNLQTTLDGKASTSHTHEFADIYKQTTRIIINENTNEEEEITETKTLQEVLNEYEQSLTNVINQGLNGKANVSHTHEISDIYKTIQIEENGQTTTTTKTLQQILNEYEQSMMNAINGKANSSHTHNATDIIYKSGVNVKQELDNINQQLDIKDENGNKIDILAAIFGTTTGVGTLIDGGLIAAVGTLQEEVALLQTQIATLATSDLTNDVLDVVNSAGEVVEGGASVWKGLKGIANAWKQMRTAAAGYVNLSNAEAIPLMPL